MMKDGLRRMVHMPFDPIKNFLQAFEYEEWKAHLGNPHHMLQKYEVVFINKIISALTCYIALQDSDRFNPFPSEVLD